MAKLISFVIPVYNEEKNLPLLYGNLKEILKASNHEHEIIFVNDGSSDGSASELKKISLLDNKVKVIEFSRNFGKEIALTAGLHNCFGDCGIMLDADLQHPIELIPEFIAKWENGAEVVVGVRSNNSEKFIKKYGSLIFYKIMNRISDTELLSGATDFRLL